MITTFRDNWYTWNYGDQAVHGRQTSDNLPFRVNFSKYHEPVRDFKQELILAAQSTRDYYPDLKPSLIFSGGMDSEVMLRSYLAAGIDFDVYIFRYEDDLNLYDVSYAITICSMLGVPYRLLDFKIYDFYENHAEGIAELAQLDIPQTLPLCRMLDLVDGLPITGCGELLILRHNSEYSQEGIWNLCFEEYETGWAKYVQATGRPAIPSWFKWTPGLFLSFFNLDWCTNLINDRYTRHTMPQQSKIDGYREAYPDLIFRHKKDGFEDLTQLIKEFDDFLFKKNQGLRYRQTVNMSIVDVCNIMESVL